MLRKAAGDTEGRCVARESKRNRKCCLSFESKVCYSILLKANDIYWPVSDVVFAEILENMEKHIV